MFERPEDRARRHRASVLASVALHGLLLWLLDTVELPQPEEEEVIQIALVARGTPGEAAGLVTAPEPPSTPPPSEPQPSPQPPTRSPRPQAPIAPPAPRGQRLAAVQPHPPSPPVPRSAPPAPLSFREWQRRRASPFLPLRTGSAAAVGGTAEGLDALTRTGRSRCEPPPHRELGLLYLLFDSSGSMNELRQAQALSCAQQYARAALAAGAQVVVVNFALSSTFSPPTRDMLDVQIALRAASDNRATILPTRDLQAFFDASVAADLVIVSDGMFRTTPDVLVWYSYFLELNPDNRGTMYTVGAPGHREAVGRLRNIGFDVYMYEQIQRTP